MTGFLRDVGLAVRPLWRRPMLIAMVSVVLGLSVAVSTVLFGVLMALRMLPPGVKAPEQLVYIYSTWGTGSSDPVIREFIDLMEARGSALGEFTSHSPLKMRLSSDGNAAELVGEVVEPNYLTVLGAGMYLGRFLRHDDGSSGSSELVIGYNLWRNRFGADPSVVGKLVQLTSLRGASFFTVVGVAEPGFRGLSDPVKPSQLWIDVQDRLHAAGPGLPVVRLSPDVDTQQVRTFLATITHAAQELAKRDGALPFRMSTAMLDSLKFSAHSARDIQNPTDPSAPMVPRPLLLAILVFIALVELIVTANVAGLVMAYRAAQSRDLAVQRLLGASKRRIIFQRFIEACALSVPGALLGIAGAAVLLGPLRLMTSSRVPLDVHLDWATAVFGGVVALGAVLALGALSFRNTADNLISGMHATKTSLRRSIRYAILVPQIAGSAALLAPAGIYLETLTAGFRDDAATGAETLVITMSRADAPRTIAISGSDGRAKLFATSTLAALRSLPGVESVAFVDDLPLRPFRQMPLRVRGSAVAGTAGYSEVSDEYFRSLGLGIASGRGFDSRADADAGAVVVSRELARRLKIDVGTQLAFGATEPASFSADTWLSVVGIADDVIPVIGDRTPQPLVYLPADHARVSRLPSFFSQAGQVTNATVRTRLPVDVAHLRRVVVASVPSAEILSVRSMSSMVDEVLLPSRTAGWALAGAGLCALVLASCGLAGMISYLIAERWREIGIRSALGADSASLTRLFMREGAICLALGLVAGSGLAFIVLRLLTWALPRPSGVSALWYLSGPTVIAAVVMTVGWFSSRRASLCNPADTLRGL